MGLRRTEVTGEYRRMYSFMICTDHHHSGDQIKEKEMGGACIDEKGNTHRVLIGKHDG
jgi:hypothetical protein